MTMQKWGGLASILLAVSFIAAPLLYVIGDWQEALGRPLAYGLADFIFGPLTAACLVAAVIALRERIGQRGRSTMSLALLAAALAAAMFMTAAAFRAANRDYLQYLEPHPTISDSMSTTLLMAWTPIVSGVISVGRHFMGWSLILIGSAGLSSKALPRPLCFLYLVSGVPSLFTYMLPIRQVSADLGILDAIVVLLCAVCVIWQGIVLWMGGPGQPKALEINPERA